MKTTKRTIITTLFLLLFLPQLKSHAQNTLNLPALPPLISPNRPAADPSYLFQMNNDGIKPRMIEIGDYGEFVSYVDYNSVRKLSGRRTANVLEMYREGKYAGEGKYWNRKLYIIVVDCQAGKSSKIVWQHFDWHNNLISEDGYTNYKMKEMLPGTYGGDTIQKICWN
jgi:hypothetical protein